MRHLVHILAVGAIGAVVAASAPPALAKTTKECRADYVANEDAIKASGQSKKAYIAACKAGPDAAAPDAATTAPAAKAPAVKTPASSADAAPVLTKTKAQCAAEYSANLKAIKAAGQSKAAFDADCRAGTEKIGPAPAPVAAAPAIAAPAAASAAPPAASAIPAKVAPADPMAPKPIMSPAEAAPVPAAPAPAAKPDAAPNAKESELKAKCPSDRIVWANKKSGFYDLAGAKNYGKTKPGEFMCEMDAIAAGDRPAEGGK